MFSPFSTEAGTEHSLANSVQRSYALEWEARIDHPCVPARTLSQAVTPFFLVCFHGGFHETSHKPTLPQQLRRRSSTDVQRCSAERGKLCSTFQVTGPNHLTVPPPSFPSWQLSLTENQCRSAVAYTG